MATFYIGPNGDDANDGSYGSPWYNLITAIKRSNSGDTIIVKSGVYNGQLAGDTTSQSRLNTRTIVGETDSPFDTVLDFDGNSFLFNGATSTPSDTVTLKNLTIKRVKALGGGGVFAPDNSALVIKNTILQECIGSSTTNINGVAGLITQAQSMVMDRVLIINPFSTLDGPVAPLFGWGRYDHNVTIGNSVIYIGDVTPPAGAQSVNWFNISRGGTATGNISFKNTIVFKTGAALDYTRFMAGGLTITFENSCVKDFAYPFGDEPTLTDCIFTDPLFVDADNGDFRLRPSSPCIGTGAL